LKEHKHDIVLHQIEFIKILVIKHATSIMWR